MEEAKAAVRKDSCPVLGRIARANLQNADEPLFQALVSCGLALNLPMKELQLGPGFAYPYFPPKDLLQSMASNGNFHKVLGVPVAYSDYVLPKFWEKYRKLYPQHDLFAPHQIHLDFKHLLPFYLHGDGGRTYRKDSILILSMYNALGEGTAKLPAELQPHPDQKLKRQRSSHGHGDISYEPGVNLRGNTLSNRFLFCAMKTEFYKSKRERFDSLLEQWACHLYNLFEEGFEYNGDVWRIAILGLTGDAPFLREAGYHERSFSNVSKTSKQGARQLKGCCWLCDAGRTGGPPFEDVRITMAGWVSTCGMNNPLPWSVPSPLLTHLPVNDMDLAAFYRPDIFHVYHAGVGKDFTASSIIYIMKHVYKRRNIHLSLTCVNEELKTFLKNNKAERIHFGNFSLDLLGYQTARSFPYGHWSKNMDTATIGKFVEHLCLKGLVDHPNDEILSRMIDACAAISHFMHILFTSAFYLSEAEGWQLIQSGQSFLKDYVTLAEASNRKKLCLWAMKPKLHTLAHIVCTAFQHFTVATDHVINPLAESTFMCEDFVGRVSRLSRRVSAKQHGKKILYRYMVAARLQAMDGQIG